MQIVIPQKGVRKKRIHEHKNKKKNIVITLQKKVQENMFVGF